MESKTFSPVSPERWQDIQQAFRKQAGVFVANDTGSASSHGVNFSWSYADDALSVTVVSVPWPLRMMGYDEDKVLSQFSQWIEGVQ